MVYRKSSPINEQRSCFKVPLTRTDRVFQIILFFYFFEFRMWRPSCAARARSETRAPFFIGFFFFFVQTPFEKKAQLRVQRTRYCLHIVCVCTTRPYRRRRNKTNYRYYTFRINTRRPSPGETVQKNRYNNNMYLGKYCTHVIEPVKTHIRVRREGEVINTQFRCFFSRLLFEIVFTDYVVITRVKLNKRTYFKKIITVRFVTDKIGGNTPN